jgi:colicin import membrane protein
MTITFKNKRPAKDPTRKVGGFSLSSLKSAFSAKPKSTTGSLKAAETAPKKNSFLARLFGKKDTNAKAKKQEASIDTNEKALKKKAISKKQQQKDVEEVEAKRIKEDVEVIKAEAARAAKSKVSDLLGEPQFKNKLESITGKKAESFGKKPSNTEIRSAVTTKMDDLKVMQRSDAEVKATTARDAKFSVLTQDLEVKKLTLKEKLADAKARLRERLDGIRDPAKRQEIKEQRAKDNAVKARNDANLEKEKIKTLRNDAKTKEDSAIEARKRADAETDPIVKKDLEAQSKKAEKDANNAKNKADAAKKKADDMRKKAFDSEVKAGTAKNNSKNISEPKKTRAEADAHTAEAKAKKAREDAEGAKADAKRLREDAELKE